MERITKAAYCEIQARVGQLERIVVRNIVTDIPETLYGFRWGSLFYTQIGKNYYRMVII